jgi:hypothetical protein
MRTWWGRTSDSFILSATSAYPRRPSGINLVCAEQLRKGVRGQTILVVEGNFRERPDVTARAFAVTPGYEI